MMKELKRREDVIHRLNRDRHVITTSEWIRLMTIRYDGISIRSVHPDPRAESQRTVDHDVVIYIGAGDHATNYVLGSGKTADDAIQDGVDYFLTDMMDETLELEESLDEKPNTFEITDKNFFSIFPKPSDN